MADSEEQLAFVDAYRSYVEDTLRPSERAVMEELNTWRQEGYWERYGANSAPALPDPIQRIKVRIKRAESAMDKIGRLPHKFPHGINPESLYSMRDMLGTRVVTYFKSHLPMIDSQIRSETQFELASEYPPRSYFSDDELERIGLNASQFSVRQKKPSGYASLHYVLRLKTPTHSPQPWFELQVRTMLEEVWGEVEHQLAYKSDLPMDLETQNQFWVLSNYLDTVDSHFNLLYHHSLNRQSDSDPKSEDDITTDNLPKVVKHFGFSVAQGEISKLYDILIFRGINKVAHLWGRGRREIVEAIAACYLLEYQKIADGFDVIAVLSQLPSHPSIKEAKAQTLLNIRMTRETQVARKR